MIIGDRDYEIISFRRRLTNKSEEMSCISLAQGYMAIGDTYRIYNTISGEPLIRGRFETLELALRLAKVIEKMLWDFFDIWKAYPQANLISWCKYTVKDGARLFEMVEILDKLNIITEKDLQDAYKRSDEMGERWK